MERHNTYKSRDRQPTHPLVALVAIVGLIVLPYAAWMVAP